MKEVHEYENVICGECGKGFKNQARLKIDKRLVHIRVDKVEYCEQCEKVFKNKNITRMLFTLLNLSHAAFVTAPLRISMHLESISRNVQKRIPV